MECYGLSVDLVWPPCEVVDTMKRDKKNRDSQIVFELPCGIGQCKENNLETDKIIIFLKCIM